MNPRKKQDTGTNQKVFAGVAIVAIIIVLVAFFFLFQGQATPPVDISGINVPTYMLTNQTLPQEAGGFQLLAETIVTNYPLFSTPDNSSSFVVEHTLAFYQESSLTAIKANSESEAQQVLGVFLDQLCTAGSGSRTQTSNWFLCDLSGAYVFFWNSGPWVFGVDAGLREIGEQMAEDFVQHLRTLS